MTRRILIAFVVLLSACAACAAQSGKPADVIGTWEGESLCTVQPSACHDEHVIYDVKPGDNGKLKWSADKVVNGERQNMGELDCTYENKTLTCPFARGVWALTVNGNKATGTLKLTDGTVFRKVSVERKK